MDAASPARIEAVLKYLSESDFSSFLAAATVEQFVLAKLKDTEVSFTEIARLSEVFLADHRQGVRGVLGSSAYPMQDVDFFVLPLASSFVLTYVPDGQASITMSLGLMEVLRLGCAASHLESAIGKLESDQALCEAIGISELHRMIRSLKTMTQYFNACAIIHFKEPGPLPNIEASLDENTRKYIGVTLQAVLMFVLLHELGHIEFRRSRRHLSRSTMDIAWEFTVAEEISIRKEEELYADRFAIQSVPPLFMLPLVHAATFFLHLHNYVDATTGSRPNMHPLCVNRISAMYALANRMAAADAVGHRAVSLAIETGAQLWTRAEPTLSLSVLRRFVESLSKVDWRPAQEALQILASRPVISTLG